MKQFSSRLKKASLRLRPAHLFVLALAVVLLSALPIFVSGFYNHPTADDFTFSWRVFQLRQQGAPLSEMVGQAASRSAYLYTHWQGSFAATFVMGLQPGALFGSGWYGLATVVTLGSLMAGTFAFVYVLLRRALEVDGWWAGFIALVLTFICTQFVHYATEAFYWYNGAVYYTFFHGLSLLLLACCIVAATAKTRGGAVGASLCGTALGFVVGGGNYATCAYAVLAVLAALGLAVVRRRRWGAIVPPAVFLLAAFAVSVLSPGNQVRQERTVERDGFFRSIFNSFINAVYYGDRWLNLGVLLCLLLLVPVFWHLAGRSKLSYRWPGLFTLASFCFYAAGFFPHLYAKGTSGPGRLLNVLCYCCFLVVAANLFYWLGWLRRKLGAFRAGEAGLGEAVSGWCRARLLPGLGCFALGIFATAMFSYASYTSWDAAYALYSGEAAAYRDEYAAREALLLSAPGENLVVPELTHRPVPLFHVDISAVPEENKFVANYYGVESVFAVPPEVYAEFESPVLG